MKSLKFIIILSVFLTILLLFSCQKDEKTTETINVNLSIDQPYTYDLGMFGIEEGAMITQQGNHYSISTIERLDSQHMYYYYSPAPGFTGNDEVEVKSSKGSDGANPPTDVKYYLFKFTIAG